jgi:hypothetical protein
MSLRNGWAKPKPLAKVMRVSAPCIILLFATSTLAQPAPDNTCITMGTEMICETHRGVVSSLLITDIASKRMTGFTVGGPGSGSKGVFDLIDSRLSELEPTKSAEERASAMQRLNDQASTRDYGEERFGASTLTLRFGNNDIGFKAAVRR